MKTILVIILLLTLLNAQSQRASSVTEIDVLISKIDNNSNLSKRILDTAHYLREDGGSRWDSVRIHKEIYYVEGQIVKILSWNTHLGWRNDMVAYYLNGKAIKFCRGEGFEGDEDYGKLNFAIYYVNDKSIGVTWLTSQPENVLGVDTEIYLKWAYNLLNRGLNKD